MEKLFWKMDIRESIVLLSVPMSKIYPSRLNFYINSVFLLILNPKSFFQHYYIQIECLADRTVMKI